MSEWIETSYVVKDIKNRKQFCKKAFLQDDKIIDIWCTENEEQYYMLAITKYHNVWKYSIDFDFDTVSYKMTLLSDCD